MSIRRNLLDQRSTAAANLRALPVATQIEPIAGETPRAKLAPRIYTNVGSIAVRQNRASPSNDPERQLRETRREFERLTHACRSVGGGPARNGILRTVTYMVHGKPVRITGYWANPSDIEIAKRICNRAIQAEQNWLLAKQTWEDSRRASTPNVSASASAK